MEKTFDTIYGEVKVKTAMIDTNGTDLCDGVDIYIDGKWVGDTTSTLVDHVTEDNIEDLVETYCNEV